MKQTAVEWLFEQLEFDESILIYNIKDIFDKAKEMEKQQIIDAYNEGWTQCNVFELPERSREHYETPEQYYNETFNK